VKPSTALAACSLLVALGACVGNEREEAQALEAEYRRCVEEHSPEHAECQLLQERQLRAQERYLESSRRAWGCGPELEECPAPR
jgi:hypothetical protein